MSAALQLREDREQIFPDNIGNPDYPNHEWLACMMTSWCAGQDVLPDYLGLETEQFNA
jgi:nitrogen fixation protein NifQ